jgi:hypothetical protein
MVKKDVSLALFLTIRNLYKDILFRQGTDKRWEKRRLAYITKNSPFSDKYAFLFQ